MSIKETEHKETKCFVCNKKFYFFGKSYICCFCSHTVCANCSVEDRIPEILSAKRKKTRTCIKCKPRVTPRAARKSSQQIPPQKQLQLPRRSLPQIAFQHQPQQHQPQQRQPPPPQPPQQQQQQQHQQQHQQEQNSILTQWTCRVCTFLNHQLHSKCEICGTPKPKEGKGAEGKGAEGKGAEGKEGEKSPERQLMEIKSLPKSQREMLLLEILEDLILYTALNKLISEYDSLEVLIFIKFFVGPAPPLTLECKITDTILSVKQKIHEKQGTPVEQQYLLFGYKELVNSLSLECYNIQNESTILLKLRVKIKSTEDN